MYKQYLKQTATDKLVPTNEISQNVPIQTNKNQNNVQSSTQNRSLHQRPIIPNFPYSPLTTPDVSPEHRLHPSASVMPSCTNNTSTSNNNTHFSLSSLYKKPNRTLTVLGKLTTEDQQRELRSVSVTEDTKGLIQLNQYNIRHQLGQGSYGLVQLAYNQEDSTFYALKILSKKKLMKSSGLFNRPPPMRKSTSSMSSASARSPQQTTVDPLQKIYREIAIHKKLDHPNIVKLIEVLDDSSQDFLYMVFEYVENGAVMQIGKDTPFTESKARKYFIDTLLGLEYLHYQKIIHRDIKPANLLLSSTDQIKIADFGVSNEFSGDDVYLSSSAGSPAFMAPESVKDGEQQFAGKALDIWALGITLFAFLFGKVPFEHFNRFLLYQMIINNPVLYPETPEVSESAIDLLKQMLEKNPINRIKLHEIKVHDWVIENGQNDPLPTEAQNCGIKQIEVTDEEVANSIFQYPKLETVIKIKMLLKHRSFRNPLRSSSISRLSQSDIKKESPLHSYSNNLPNVRPREVSPVKENDSVITDADINHHNDLSSADDNDEFM